MKKALENVVLSNGAALGLTILLLSIINIITKLTQQVSPLSSSFYSWDYTIGWFLVPYFCGLVFFLIVFFRQRSD
jgi:hypothetical protein